MKKMLIMKLLKYDTNLLHSLGKRKWFSLDSNQSPSTLNPVALLNELSKMIYSQVRNDIQIQNFLLICSNEVYKRVVTMLAFEICPFIL